MAQTTFAGPVRSLGGFISSGSTSFVSLTANTTLTAAAHAGKVLLCNDADGVFTLPSIVTTTPGDPTDPGQLNNLGMSFTFVVVTAATDMDIKTDGTDKFLGMVYTGITTAATGKTWVSAASNDVITQNGTTLGGVAGSYLRITAIASAQYFVEGMLLGSGTIATPFADA